MERDANWSKSYTPPHGMETQRDVFRATNAERLRFGLFCSSLSKELVQQLHFCAIKYFWLDLTWEKWLHNDGNYWEYLHLIGGRDGRFYGFRMGCMFQMALIHTSQTMSCEVLSNISELQQYQTCRDTSNVSLSLGCSAQLQPWCFSWHLLLFVVKFANSANIDCVSYDVLP